LDTLTVLKWDIGMEKGYNSDLKLKGLSYHIQTEDWGPDNPFLVSKIFRNGAVIKSFKTPYERFMPQGFPISRPIVREALKKQHSKVLDLLVSGQCL
jgi:hypothetical protein